MKRERTDNYMVGCNLRLKAHAEYLIPADLVVAQRAWAVYGFVID